MPITLNEAAPNACSLAIRDAKLDILYSKKQPDVNEPFVIVLSVRGIAKNGHNLHNKINLEAINSIFGYSYFLNTFES